MSKRTSKSKSTDKSITWLQIAGLVVLMTFVVVVGLLPGAFYQLGLAALVGFGFLVAAAFSKS